MHYFYLPSLAANFFIIIGLASQMYYNSEVLQANPEISSSFATTLTEFNFPKLPLFFGVALYSFEGVGVTLSIRDSMEKPQDLPNLLKSPNGYPNLIYMLFSTMTCLVLGNSVQEIIFFTLPADDPFYLLIQILYAVSVLFTYPIQLFSCYSNYRKFCTTKE